MGSKHTMYKSLSCDLSAGEITTYSNELANITSQQAEIEGEKKEVMSDFTAKLNKCIADARVLARKITTRKEDRQVECDLDFDYARGVVYIVRSDTGVIIDQRKLTDEERQERLDLDGEQDKQQAFEEKLEETSKTVAQTATVPQECQQCHKAKGCDDCCKTCDMPCPSAMNCRKDEADPEPIEEAPEKTDEEKDAICHEWRGCDYTVKCFQTDTGSCLKDDAEKTEAAKV